uniref:EOG090X07V0 n=1 Tax=Scapholeberis mucronata TaxID=202097 RepID=A0A4Y7NM75_9CRUS|nr:EOG090X07V0 [Scapholeberis mucronata]
MSWSTVVKLCVIFVISFAAVDLVTAQGRGGASSSGGTPKLKEEVEFLKANLSALWDIVSALQTRAAEERQDESEELVVSLGLKKKESWGPNLKNNFDSQIRVRPQDESRSYPAVSAAYLLFRRKDYSTWRRVKNTDELYFWHRGTTLLLNLLKPDGSVQQVKLGDPIQDPDAAPQVVIAVGVWVAAELEDKLSYCLISVVQAPANSYLSGVSVKISEKYRPPRRPTLPPGLCRFEPSSHLFCENIDLIDEVKAIRLVESIRDLRVEETLRRKLKISQLESDTQVENNDEEPANNPPLANPIQQNPNLHGLNGQIMQHTQARMEVLTPIQSFLIEEKKKENMATINLSEFESYSTNPFEEMELKTLNDKEELALLLQPAGQQASYSLPFAGYPNPPQPITWGENQPPAFQPTVHPYSKPSTDWLQTDAHFFNVDTKSMIGMFNTTVEVPLIPSTSVSRKNLRQAKSVPDLSDASIGIGGPSSLENSSITEFMSPSKRLSSRTPPPRLSAESISRPKPKPILNLQCPWEKNLSVEGKRLVQQLSDMGFPRERSAKVITRLGVNEKDAVDQLLLIQKLEDSGHFIDRIESALDVLRPCNDYPKLVENHLTLVNQLAGLGFDLTKINSALVAAGHDCDKAIDLLLMK